MSAIQVAFSIASGLSLKKNKANKKVVIEAMTRQVTVLKT